MIKEELLHIDLSHKAQYAVAAKQANAKIFLFHRIALYSLVNFAAAGKGDSVLGRI